MTKNKEKREFETPFKYYLIMKFSARKNVVNSSFLEI